MKKRNRFNLLGITFAVMLPFLCIAFLQPVDASQDNCLQVAGTVEAVTESTSYDVSFKLKDDPAIYYVNRGLERGLELISLKKDLIGQDINLWHAQSWQSTSLHIAHIEVGEEVVYSEWK